MKAHFMLGRLSVVAVALASCLLLGHCAWFSPPPAPSSGPSSGATQPQGRTITEGNLMTAADLPAPIGGGR